MADIKGKRIAMLATDGVERVELTQPRDALRAAGATVTVVSPKGGAIQGMDHDEKGETIASDAALSAVKPEQFDGLVLPGGVANPDTLRTMPDAMAFVRAFTRGGKPVAAICHGPWSLIEVDAVRGKTMTSWPSLRKDLENAGAHWVDREVVRDGMLVTSRKPEDLDAFSREAIGMFAEARG